LLETATPDPRTHTLPLLPTLLPLPPFRFHTRYLPPCREEVHSYLVELQQAGWLKPTDREAGIWEFNMVERDIVYDVIPHFQRRRMHAQLALELERSLSDENVGSLTTIAYHWNQACAGYEVAEKHCTIKAIEYWHRAAEVAYSSSSLMEALRLFQKASKLADMLHDSGAALVDLFNGGVSPSHDSAEPERTSGHDSGDNFQAMSRNDLGGSVDWGLVSRLMRAHREKSMASCCLGMVLQHMHSEFNSELEFWGISDYFTLLMEHAIHCLTLLGAPPPSTILELLASRDGRRKRRGLLALLCCGMLGGGGDSGDALSDVGGSDSSFRLPDDWQYELALNDEEVNEARDVLLVLIIAAENYSLHHDPDNFVRLLSFCRYTCIYFQKCSGSTLDPFSDIRTACALRMTNYCRGITHMPGLMGDFWQDTEGLPPQLVGTLGAGGGDGERYS